MREASLDYFYGDEVKIDSFCRLPRIFITDDFYRGIPLEIKFLYSLMLDRVALSMRNNWREDGRVFIYFTVQDAMRLLHVGRSKAIRLFDRMETLGLILRRRQGQGLPNRIFVRTFVEVEDAEDDVADFMETEAASADVSIQPAEVTETPVCETPPTPAQIDTPDTCDTAGGSFTPVKNDVISDLLHECVVGVRRLGDLLLSGGVPECQTSRNQTSRLPFSGSLDFPNRNPNYIKERYTKYSYYNQSIHQEGTALYEGDGCEKAGAVRKEKNMESLRGLIRENIDYEGLLRDYPNRRREIAGYVEIMAQACCSDRREIRINRRDCPQSCVRSCFEKLNRRHIVYVLKCMANIEPDVRNIRACALSTLYNSYAILQRGSQSKKSREKARKRYKNWHEADE